MDAREFFRERKRMHEYYVNKGSTRCGKCPMGECIITTGTVGGCEKLLWEYPEKVIEVVEQWSTEHPHKTRQSEFLKMFPTAMLDSDGILSISPCTIDSSIEGTEMCKKYQACADCRERYWLEEIRDDEVATE